MSDLLALIHTSNDSLALMESVNASLARIDSLDDLKEISDKSEALRKYYKLAGDSLEAQNSAAIVKLGAERRAGECLKDMEKHPGGNRSHNTTSSSPLVPTTLEELGIDKYVSSRCQKLASIPEKKYQAHIQKAVKAHEEITTAGTLKLAPKPPAKKPADDVAPKKDEPPKDKQPKDKAGKVLPDRADLRKAFTSRELFSLAEKARAILAGHCLEISRLIPPGEQFNTTTDQHLKKLFETLQHYEPLYVCRECEGGGCKQCRGKGYVCKKDSSK